MAYDSGTVADLAELVTFIHDTCTDNGWTLSGNVLHKGTCYVEILADGSVGIRIRGGNGIDGSNLLTDAAPDMAFFGTIAGIALDFPLTAEIHINTSPDEVYVVINYQTTYYSMMAFGQSDVPGLTGTGNWFYANRLNASGTNEYVTGVNGIGTYVNYGGHADGAAMFSVYKGSDGTSIGGHTNALIHGDIDGLGWCGTAGQSYFPSSNPYISPLLGCLPNTWNSEAILLPFPIYVPRSSGSKNSLVGDLKHIRHTRIDYLNPGDIITLGADEWKVYPWFRKDATTPAGGSGLTHSGTLAYALRYTGP